MPKLTDEQLAQIIRDNLVDLCSQTKHAKKKIADECNISPSMITKWTSPTQPHIPSSANLKIIADLFCVTVDWLLTDHSDMKETKKVRTYADAFRMYMKLYSNDLIWGSKSADPIMKYFINKLLEARSAEIEESELSQWTNKTLLMYNDMLIRDIPIEVKDYIFEKTPEIKTMSDDRTMYNLAKKLQDSAFVSEMTQACYDDQEFQDIYKELKKHQEKE